MSNYWDDCDNFQKDVTNPDVIDDSLWDLYDSTVTPKLVLDGVYKAVLTGWTYSPTNANGNPSICFSFTIQGGTFSGQVLRHQSWLTEKAMWRTKQFCDKIGIHPKKNSNDYPKIWCEIQVMVKEGDYGKRFSEITEVQRICSPAPADDVPVETAPAPPAPADCVPVETIAAPPAPAGNKVPGAF